MARPRYYVKITAPSAKGKLPNRPCNLRLYWSSNHRGVSYRVTDLKRFALRGAFFPQSFYLWPMLHFFSLCDRMVFSGEMWGSQGLASCWFELPRAFDLKERALVQQLVDAENRDRESLYLEIAKANNFPKESVPKIKSIFAKSWVEQVQSGWWIQDERGNWKKK